MTTEYDSNDEYDVIDHDSSDLEKSQELIKTDILPKAITRSDKVIPENINISEPINNLDKQNIELKSEQQIDNHEIKQIMQESLQRVSSDIKIKLQSSKSLDNLTISEIIKTENEKIELQKRKEKISNELKEIEKELHDAITISKQSTLTVNEPWKFNGITGYELEQTENKTIMQKFLDFFTCGSGCFSCCDNLNGDSVSNFCNYFNRFNNTFFSDFVDKVHKKITK